MTQTTLAGRFARAELTAAELAKWDEALDYFARYGSLPLSRIGTFWARRFVELGLVVYFRGALRLTEVGEGAE